MILRDNEPDKSFQKKTLRKRDSIWGRMRYNLYLLRRSPLALFGMIIVLGLIIIAIITPYIVQHPEFYMDLPNKLQPPSWQYPFGTDERGMDIFTRILYGTRISLIVGIVVVIIQSIIGITLGSISGYFGGKIDIIIMRLTDMFLAFPSLILAIIISFALGKGIVNAMIAVSLAQWPWIARLVRSQTLSIREEQYIEAAKSVGSGPLRIIFNHVLPNCMGPLIVRVSMDFGFAILTTASLGFIGVGAQPPSPEWGLAVSIGRRYIMDQWWIPLFPGLAILFAVMGFNLMGDGLRDILAPRQKK